MLEELFDVGEVLEFGGKFEEDAAGIGDVFGLVFGANCS